MIYCEEKVVAFIGLGSNLADPIVQIDQARRAINDLAKVDELGFSSLYRSPPMGPQDQPDYTNAVMKVVTQLPALVLLRALQKIENSQGRLRTGERWVARTLDLDLLLFGEQCIREPDLVVPHPGLADRAFVLYPLEEIDKDIQVPGLGTITALVSNCPLSGLIKIN
jgi:2-amino-4-hydroxy-6-hydroxymethyldihydropteridine diphosphokinase